MVLLFCENTTVLSCGYAILHPPSYHCRAELLQGHQQIKSPKNSYLLVLSLKITSQPQIYGFLSITKPAPRLSFALDKNCWVWAKWLLHFTVAGLASSPFPFRACFKAVTVECNNHFLHTQQFLSNAKLTLPAPLLVDFIYGSPLLFTAQPPLLQRAKSSPPLCPISHTLILFGFAASLPGAISIAKRGYVAFPHCRQEE